MDKEIVLRYHLENDGPVDLQTFVKSLTALQSEYAHFIDESKEFAPPARLNIRKVEHGSIIFEMVSAVSSAMPIFQHFNTIAEFALHLKRIIQRMSRGDVPKQAKNTQTLRNVYDLLDPVARIPNSNLTIQVFEIAEGADPVFYHNCSFGTDAVSANSVQNVSCKTMPEVVETEKIEERKTKVLLALAQINSDTESKSNKGVIEAFSPKAKKLIFEDKAHRQIIEADENPLKYYYCVDATAMYAEGKLVAYRIERLHEYKIDREEED